MFVCYYRYVPTSSCNESFLMIEKCDSRYSTEQYKKRNLLIFYIISEPNYELVILSGAPTKQIQNN